ncbi:MAG TPA: 1-acyl-sn-glycerol-3-phosphate acyltransferase [Candidatus Babeliales bacterium]|nr:1-acyl-sn-glycerol-3-phosphate acyltransferase [Candidatus Babeliales bacterium]
MEIKRLIRTLVSRFLLLLIMIACIIPFITVLILPARIRSNNRFYYWFADFFYKAVVKCSFLPVKIIGKEHIPHDEPAVIVANHQSSLDIPLVGSLLDRYPHVWMATTTLLDSPILRFVLPRVTVLVDMSTPLTGMKSLLKAINLINGQNRHVIIFPEGTRYSDGSVHEFYAGFVILSRKTGRPVVPIRIFGANKAYPPGVFLLQDSPITLVVGAPMREQEFESDEEFKNRVYQWFLDQKEP